MSKNVVTTATVNFDKNDLVAIMMAKVEAYTDTEIAKRLATVRDLEKRHKDLTAQLAAACHHLGEKEPSVVKITEGIAAFNNRISAKVTYGTAPDKDGHVDVTIKISDPHTYGSVTVGRQLKADRKVLDLAASVQSSQEALAEAQADLVEWRRKAGKLSSVERQIKASLAEKHLRASDSGRELLDALEGKTPEQLLLALPAL